MDAFSSDPSSATDVRNCTNEIIVCDVLFAGCDSGFGHNLSIKLDSLGYTVFSGCLMPDREGAQQLKEATSERLHIVPVDVTNDWQVREAQKYVKQNIGDKGKKKKIKKKGRWI